MRMLNLDQTRDTLVDLRTRESECGIASRPRFASLGKELVATKPTFVLSMPQNFVKSVTYLFPNSNFWLGIVIR